MSYDPKRVEAIFSAALAQASVAERVAYLAQACAGELALRPGDPSSGEQGWHWD